MNQPSARYYTNPPDIPMFLYKHRAKKNFGDLIAWSIKEYDDALRLMAKRGAMRTVKYLTEEYSPMRILAEMPNFRAVVAKLDMDTYNELSARERQFIRRAYEIYENLRKSKLL